MDEVSNIIKESIENTIGGNGYAHPKVSQWTNAVVESCLASLTKLQKPFKYIGNILNTLCRRKHVKPENGSEEFNHGLGSTGPKRVPNDLRNLDLAMGAPGGALGEFLKIGIFFGVISLNFACFLMVSFFTLILLIPRHNL